MKKTEKMTVTLPENRKNAMRPFPLKFNRVLENGNEVLTYVNSNGQLKDLPMEDYLKLIPKSKEAEYRALGIKHVYFKSQITNLSEGMNAEDIRTSNLGFKVDKEKEPGMWDFFCLFPDAIFNGVQKSRSALVDVKIESEIKNKRTVDRKVRTEITLWLDSQPDNILADILIYFGINRGERNKDEMINILIEGETQFSTVGEQTDISAVLFKDNNLEIFRRVFMQDADPNKKYVLAINKAKAYGLLVQGGSENNKGWYRDANFIGENDTDLIRYYIANTAPFNNLILNIERIEKTNKVSDEKEMINPNSQTTDINKKVELTSTLNSLVNAGTVILPKDILVSDLSVEEMEELITPKVSDNTGFQTIKDGETKMQYKARMSHLITKLINEGQLEKIEKRNTLSNSDMEVILTNYYSSLNTDHTKE